MTGRRRNGRARPARLILPETTPCDAPLATTLLAAAAVALMPDPAFAQPVAAGDRIGRIKSSGTLRVCIWPDYYGITFRNPRSGELTGIDETLWNRSSS